jgi:hypothetical protein
MDEKENNEKINRISTEKWQFKHQSLMKTADFQR